MNPGNCTGAISVVILCASADLVENGEGAAGASAAPDYCKPTKLHWCNFVSEGSL